MPETIKVSIFGNKFTYNYHIPDMIDKIEEGAKKDGDNVVWWIPNFDTPVHKYAKDWIKHRKLESVTKPIQDCFERADLALVFYGGQSDGVIEAANAAKGEVYLIEDRDSIEVRPW